MTNFREMAKQLWLDVSDCSGDGCHGCNRRIDDIEKELQEAFNLGLKRAADIVVGFATPINHEPGNEAAEVVDELCREVVVRIESEIKGEK